MRLLHTGDWHIGKRLYGLDRRDEARAALDEVVAVARREHVDAVLVAGDLLDRRVIDAAPLRDALEVLEELATVAPVLVVAGNHDDPELWEALSPFLASRGIHAAGRIRPPERGVVTVETAAGPLHVALMPWPEPRRVAELGDSIQHTKLKYAEGVGWLLNSYAEELRSRRRAQGGAAVLVAHIMVDGALGGGGEREMTMGITYAVSPAALPTDLDYIALGHVHRPQAIPRVAAPARYAGSPMALDFSEDNHVKSACLLEITAERTAVREAPLTAARPLVRLRGPIDALAGMAEPHGTAWFACEVDMEEPVLDLMRQVREAVPGALRAEPRYPQIAASDTDAAPAAAAAPPGTLDLTSQYEAWYAAQGRPLSPALRTAFAAAVEAAERQAGDS